MASPTKSVLERQFSRLAKYTAQTLTFGNGYAYPDVVVEVNEVVDKEFVVHGLADDEWIAAFNVLVSFAPNVSGPKPMNMSPVIMLALEHLAIEYLLHRNILVLVDVKKPVDDNN